MKMLFILVYYYYLILGFKSVLDYKHVDMGYEVFFFKVIFKQH